MSASVYIPIRVYLKKALERKALQKRTGEHTQLLNRIECGECKLNYASAADTATSVSVTKSKLWASFKR